MFPSSFDENTALCTDLLGDGVVSTSDRINHASIIDGIRQRRIELRVFAHDDMDDLKAQLMASSKHQLGLVATDGVSSMDGSVNDFASNCVLAARYAAIVFVDVGLGIGVLGPLGGGTIAQPGVAEARDDHVGNLRHGTRRRSGGISKM